MKDKINELVICSTIAAVISSSSLAMASPVRLQHVQQHAVSIDVNKNQTAPAVSEADLTKPWSMNDLIALDDSSAFHGSTLADEPFPRLQVLDANNNIKVLAEVPGVKLADIQLLANGDVLCIKGKRTVETGDKVVVSELSTGTFERRVRLPHLVRPDQATASLAEGILSISLPRWQTAEAAHKISIVKPAADKAYRLADNNSHTSIIK